MARAAKRDAFEHGGPVHEVHLPVGTPVAGATGLTIAVRVNAPALTVVGDAVRLVLILDQGARPEAAGNDEQVDVRSIGEPEVRHVTTLHVIFQHPGGPTRIVIVGEVMRVEAHRTTSVMAVRVRDVYVRRDRSG